MIDLTKSQLNAILSALDNQPRNPNSKDAARKAIGKHAEQLGLTCDEIRTAAAGLLDGRVSPAEFRAALRDDAFGSADFMVEAPAEPADDGADESAEREAYIMPNAGPLATTPPAPEGKRSPARTRGRTRSSNC